MYGTAKSISDCGFNGRCIVTSGGGNFVIVVPRIVSLAFSVVFRFSVDGIAVSSSMKPPFAFVVLCDFVIFDEKNFFCCNVMVVDSDDDDVDDVVVVDVVAAAAVVVADIVVFILAIDSSSPFPFAATVCCCLLLS